MANPTAIYFVYDTNWSAIAEYSNSMTLQASDVTVGVDDHAARVEDSAVYFYYNDALETVAGLTDASGDRFEVVRGLPHRHYLLRHKPDVPRAESTEDKAQTRDPAPMS